MNVLLIPDRYLGNPSGAHVAQKIANYYLTLNCKVGIYSSELLNEQPKLDNLIFFARKPYNGLSNWIERDHKNEFNILIDSFKPDIVLTIGSISNKNICYLEICNKRKIKFGAFIFMQDFFCAKLYANLVDGPCNLCLKGSVVNSILHKCTVNRNADYLNLTNKLLVLNRRKKALLKAKFVITSSDEQVNQYIEYGFKKEQICKIPLPFFRERVLNTVPLEGDYFIWSAQNRIEKGIHLIKPIMESTAGVKLKICFSGKEEAVAAIQNYHWEDMISGGSIEVFENVSWETGLNELYNNAKAVIIPSIWPTTTEYSLLEALGCSKPIVTFKVGIHDEIIQNYVNGFKANLNDTREFGGYMMELHNDALLREKISSGSKNLYEKLTSDSSIMDQFKALLN